LQAASAQVDNVVLAGDVNVDTARRYNVRYRCRCLMLAHDNAVADANMRYLETGITYRSHGQHVREEGKAREHESILNHICVSKDLVATINVLTDTTTDHFPLLASLSVAKSTTSNKSIERRNFKKLSPRSPRSA
jgi:endonuclease/exonuclease/phosphatase family metal-dependent hydrolase